MKVFIIGGTGLLGSQAAAELIARGHEVTSIALPPLPQGATLPSQMGLTFGNYLEMGDDELRACFSGCDGFIFAAGVDERVEGPAPIYEMYRRFNIDPLRRLLPLAMECGVRHVAICGSYFSYFDKIWPAQKLSEHHPYIRSRIEQEDVALSFAHAPAGDATQSGSVGARETAAGTVDDGEFDVAVLELPYIFGTQPGRKPVWVFLAQMIRDQKHVTLWPRGGTAMVTVKQVGQALAGALENNRGGTCYPIGFYNYSWKQLLSVVHRALGCPHKRIVTIPDWMFALGARKLYREQQAGGIEGGLDMRCWSHVQCAQTFIDRSLGCDPLGVEPDDMDAAIEDSIRLCLAILDGRTGDIVAMKGE